MTRLTDLSGAAARITTAGITPVGITPERWDPRSVDVASLVYTAQALRARFIAAHLRAAVAAIGRRSGLSALLVALRRRRQHRRTLTALTQLDDRMLQDIGVSRTDIDATAAFCCDVRPVAEPSAWQRLGARLDRERRRRQTVRELSSMSDEILADVGIERAEIPALAAALASGQPIETAGVESSGSASAVPLAVSQPGSVLAFVAVRRSAQQAIGQNIDRPAA